MPQYQWAIPYNTNGFNGYWPNPGVKTNGIPMITTRANRAGEHPIIIGSIYRGYGSGPGSIWQGIYYRGVETTGGAHFAESGGVFDFFIRGSAGTLQFGRQQGTGYSVLSENEAYSWDGTLSGSFDWSQVSTAPHIDYEVEDDTEFHFDGWDVDDEGGTPVWQIRRQMRVNGGSWGNDTASWGDIYHGTPGNSYQFRFYARNDVGDSQYTTGPQITLGYAGGRRATGSSTTRPLTIARRYTGTSWKDLVIRKRYTGSQWKDINN